MSANYLYAVLGASPAGPLGVGLAGESLRTIECGRVIAVVGAMTVSPGVSPETLRGHDAVVRRLADRVEAVLPARFGSIASDDAVLCERLHAAADDLCGALARVASREQMILRVFSDEAPLPMAPVADVGDAGPGTRYLTTRASAQRAATVVAELAPLRPVLDRFVVAERVERHETAPLVASVYHLVARGSSGAYTRAVEDAARRLAGTRLTVSGPWAPYAFTPDTLG